MPEFIVCHVRADLIGLWNERWALKGEPSKRALDADKRGELGLSFQVTAKDEKVAREAVKEKYPDHAIMLVKKIRTR